ncbi:MAG TPA: rRNA maturation RNase YbeY [Candidatus Borkfalkia faecavium]|uniref:Endoribonuclease YbeY n=1 Tax=Candidatus Borkfalkia faecavium TaxID=2838508 RepID=A0A9D1W0I8_9FIRM|nr:rRNA maturation RNase YbeY [Candidatus Borkfalkia faecavium]
MAELILHCEEEGFDAALLEAHALAGIDSDVLLSAELVFTDEAGIRALNAAERGIDAVTDVLSFPNLEGIRGVPLRKGDFPFDIDEEGALFLGSVVICRQRAAEQAQEYGHSLRREVYYLAVHGLCHLLGYDHETEEDKAEMRAREEAVLAEMNIARDEA